MEETSAVTVLNDISKYPLVRRKNTNPIEIVWCTITT